MSPTVLPRPHFWWLGSSPHKGTTSCFSCVIADSLPGYLLSVQRSLLQPGRLSCQARVCPWTAIIIKTRKAGMTGAGSATVTAEGRCVPSSPARCLPVATPPFVLDSAARPAQVKAGCHLVVHHHLQPCDGRRGSVLGTLSQLSMASAINSHRVNRIL